MEKKNPVIQLKEVTINDSEFLYDLLIQRDPKTFISHSHEKIPTYEQHVKFVKSKPYLKWYIIKFQNEKVGSISLSNQNEVGIWLTKDSVGKGIGTMALKLFLKLVPRSKYLANINPKNLESIKFFKKNGFKLMQCTYEFIPS